MRAQSGKTMSLGGLLLFLSGCFLLLSGCVSDRSNLATAKSELFWPPLPLEPKIQWTGELNNRQDAGIGKGFWKRVVEFIAGEEPEGIVKPYGLFVDNHARLFVVDVGLSMVHMFDRKEKEYAQIGDSGVRVFQTPVGITGDGEDQLFITDSGAGTVFKYNLRQKTLATFIEQRLLRPTGIAYNPRNRLLYVSDTGSHQVVVFDGAARERYRIGERGEKAGDFNFPTDLFIDGSGDLYVTDALNSRIQVFSASGAFIRTFGSAGDTPGYFSKPKGVAVDSEGHVYVSDAIQDCVQIFDKEGRLLLNFGVTGNAPGQFWMPSGVFIDGSDKIYVADSYNRRVQEFKYLKASKVEPVGPHPTPVQ